MKRCPECRRNYYDDRLLYCLDDGSALLEGPASMDEPATAFLQQPQSEPQTALINSVAPNKSGETRAWTPDPSGKSDTLLLLDFENTTGEEIFDHTLKTALTFTLGQSPFLDIAPAPKIAQGLRQMKRAADERVTRELAEELCLRLNLKAYLAGSISNLGSIYFLTLEAVNAPTGESLGREYEQANNKEEILAALSRAATGIREKLGESLTSIQKSTFRLMQLLHRLKH